MPPYPPSQRSPFGSWLLGPQGQSPRRLRWRIQMLLTVFITTTHLLGAGVVVVLSVLVVPAPRANHAMGLATVIGVPVYVALAVLVGSVWGTRVSFGALLWVLDEREPTLRERRRALRVPLNLTLLSGVLWGLGLVLFVVLAVLIQPERVLGIAPTVGIGAIVVCTITYLLSEFALRPLSALAMAAGAEARPRGLGVGGRQLTFWLLGTGAPLVGLAFGAVAALVRDDVTVTRLAVQVLVVSGVVLAFGFFVTTLNARSVVAPLASVREGMAEVQSGRLDLRLPVYDATELGRLQDGFNHMAEGLAERERLADLFGRHVGQDVARAAADKEVALGGESREVTVLFVDLVGSTRFAADHKPAVVVDMLNGFFDVVVEEVLREDGLVNKFVGDAVLAVFGAPTDLPDHAARGVRCARRMAGRLAEEQPQIAAGIGVYAGTVVAGNVGTQERFEYTVIGDAVNAASRLTEVAKGVEGRVASTVSTIEAAGPEEQAHWCRGETLTLRGRSKQTRVARLARPTSAAEPRGEHDGEVGERSQAMETGGV
uniref:adenylate/guanylate cyclase domain-containing protein n=1 Tax=Nocardioides acrostichi TaxID=2784339 RepID=UPI002E2C7AD1|nr:adenylate/guanylate cyclase domain-containing protein [Nocardioides acrostichi]